MKRILVVDDDAGVRQVLAAAIPTLGYEISLASSGAEAVSIYRSQKIDFVLLDMQMPEMTGPQTLAALKAIDPRAVCCFMSSSHPHTPDELTWHGAIGYLSKPFPLDELQKLISAHLGD